MFRYQLPVVWPWTSHFFPLKLGFRTCIMVMNNTYWHTVNVHILLPLSQL